MEKDELEKSQNNKSSAEKIDEQKKVFEHNEGFLANSSLNNRQSFDLRVTEVHNTYADAIEKLKNSGRQESVALLQRNLDQELASITNEYKEFNDLEFEQNKKFIKEYIDANNLEELTSDYRIEPMKEKCRLSLVIPACNEGMDIIKTLRSLAEQKDANDEMVNPEEFEVLIVVNHKEKSDEAIKMSNQQTLDAISDFKKQHPTLNIHTIFKEFTGDQGGVGWARKFGSDLALARSFNRNQKEGRQPTYIAGTDADTVIDTHYASQITKAANELGEAAYGGDVVFDENLEKSLGKNASDKLRVFMEDMRGFLLKAIGGGLQGANFAIREDIYARMGGSSTRVHSEDRENDQRLRSLQKNVTLLDTKHITSSRRMMKDFENDLVHIRSNKKTDYDKLKDTEYGKAEPTREKVDFTDAELDEIIAYRKEQRANVVIKMLTPENMNNPEMIQLIGDQYHSKLKELNKEELRIMIENRDFRKKLRVAIAYNISNLFPDKIPYTKKDKEIIGTPEL